MGATWKTPEEDFFLKTLVPKYHCHVDDGKRKEFWVETFKAWFERFPLKHPSPDAVEKAGSEEAAIKKAKKKKMKVSEART
jgi:hypothetical protein